MDKKLTTLFAELFVGLEVPVSMGMRLGAARTAWDGIKAELDLRGWVSPEDVVAAIEERQAYFDAMEAQQGELAEHANDEPVPFPGGDDH